MTPGPCFNSHCPQAASHQETSLSRHALNPFGLPCARDCPFERKPLHEGTSQKRVKTPWNISLRVSRHFEKRSALDSALLGPTLLIDWSQPFPSHTPRRAPRSARGDRGICLSAALGVRGEPLGATKSYGKNPKTVPNRTISCHLRKNSPQRHQGPVE